MKKSLKHQRDSRQDKYMMAKVGFEKAQLIIAKRLASRISIETSAGSSLQGGKSSRKKV
jgi:hypothetical protein